MHSPRPSVSIPAVPGGEARAGGVGAQLVSGPALPALTGANLTGGQVRRLVASAIEQRKRLLRTGRGHISYSALIQPMSFLQTWLDRTNDHVSQGTLRDFWQMHEDKVRLVMPGTKGGARMLETIQRLCA